MQFHIERFNIVKNIKKFILDLEVLLVNFPRKEFLTKDMIYKDALNLLELLYIANDTSNLETKKEIQIQILAKINMLDFYLERAYKKKYINERQCLAKTNDLEQITKMVYSWIKSNDKG